MCHIFYSHALRELTILVSGLLCLGILAVPLSDPEAIRISEKEFTLITPTLESLCEQIQRAQE